MNETDAGDTGETYEFVSTGENSCERCMALAGSQWKEPPNPPHAHCECEVHPRLSGIHDRRDCNDNTWEIEHISDGLGTVRYGPGGLDGFEWGFNVTIDCWDGGVHEFEIWVDMGHENDFGGPFAEGLDELLMAYAWSEIHDEAEAVGVRVCRPCSPPLVS